MSGMRKNKANPKEIIEHVCRRSRASRAEPEPEDEMADDDDDGIAEKSVMPKKPMSKKGVPPKGEVAQVL